MLEFNIYPCFVRVSSEGSGETVQTRRIARAFAARICDEYQNIMKLSTYSITLKMKIILLMILLS